LAHGNRYGAHARGGHRDLQARGGYSFTSELYSRRTSLNEVFERQNFLLDGSYRTSPRLTLTLMDSYIASVTTNLVSTTGERPGAVGHGATRRRPGPPGRSRL